MIIKASAALRNDYASISGPAKETKEPIYITRNGKGADYRESRRSKAVSDPNPGG